MDSIPMDFGRPRGERADAARNREHLLEVAREMLAEGGVDRLTMDRLAERAELGKGTVFRRFGTRAGIFAALLDDAEHALQVQVLSGPPPLGPGTDPVARMIAYGRARIGFLFDHHAVARAAIERKGSVPRPAGDFTGTHIGMLLRQAWSDGLLDIPDIDSLAVQLTAALEGPLFLYLATEESAKQAPERRPALAASWQTLVERVVSNRGARDS